MVICGVNRNAINHWVRQGVPYKHWPALREAAEEAGIPGITDAALASTRPRQSRRQAAE